MSQIPGNKVVPEKNHAPQRKSLLHCFYTYIWHMYFIFFLISSMVFRCLYYYYVWFAFLFPSTVITNRCSIIKIDWSTYYTDTITVLLFVTDRTK